MNKKLLIYIILFIGITDLLTAQYYSSGSDPASIKWYQIKTEHFRIVFPEEFEKEARRAAAIFERIYIYGSYSLGHDPKKIDVLIHSRSVYSNGFVSWAPKRIELYPTPDQDIFSQDYLQQLVIHEFRHVVQIDKLNSVFTKALSFILGQQAIGIVLGIYIPMWFLEGDAVLTETLLSHSGRGRLPQFQQELKAQLIEKKMYSYDKQYLGSYRDYVPNYYVMGYHLVSGAHNKYGKDIWEKALNNTGKRSWSITPFNHGIKKITGINKTTLYKNIFNDWKDIWQKEMSSSQFTNFDYITRKDPKFKSYRYPRFINDTIIIAQVSGPGEVTRYVTVNINTCEEKDIFTPGYHENAPFSTNARILVWAETEPNLRWQNGDFSNIWTLNLETKKAVRLTRRKRYFAPAISPDGKKISTVYVSEKNEYRILLLNSLSGETIDTIHTPADCFPLTPVWTPDGTKLVTVILTPKGSKRIYQYTLKSKAWTPVTEPAWSNIRHLFATDDEVYFSGSFTETENIYRADLKTKKIEQVSCSKFGGTSAAVNSDQSILVLSDYSSDGYQIAKINTESISNKEITIPAKAPQYSLLDKPFKEELGIPDLDTLTGADLKVKKYSKWNLFNFHSWAPLFIDFNNTDLNYGASLLSQNLLGNSFLTLGYNADKQYTREKFYFNYIYNGWFPELNFEIKYGNDNIFYNESTPVDTFVVESFKKQQFLQMNFDIDIPFNISRGAWSRYLEPSIGTGFKKAFDYDAKKSYITQQDGDWVYTGETEDFRAKGYNINTINYGLFFYNIRKRSQRDVTSRWGQIIEAKFRQTPFGNYNFGTLTAFHTRLFFPGLFRHQSIRIDNDYQNKRKGEYAGTNSGGYKINYGFPDYVKFARGYDAEYNDELYTLRNDYILPVWSPDLRIGSLAYFKRFILNLFYDRSAASYTLQNENTNRWLYNKNIYQSTGAEISTVVNIVRFIFPFQIGYRYSYRITDNKSRNEFLFSINFSGYAVNRSGL